MEYTHIWLFFIFHGALSFTACSCASTISVIAAQITTARSSARKSQRRGMEALLQSVSPTELACSRYVNTLVCLS